MVFNDERTIELDYVIELVPEQYRRDPIVKRCLYLFLIIAFPHMAMAETSVTVRIFDVTSEEGQIVVSVFDSKRTWLKKPAYQEVVEAVDGVSVEFSLPDGEYAVSVIHDIDANGKLKRSFIGIPKEPTGSSNDAKGKFGPPKYDDAKFSVAGEPVEVPIKLTQPG